MEQLSWLDNSIPGIDVMGSRPFRAVRVLFGVLQGIMPAMCMCCVCQYDLVLDSVRFVCIFVCGYVYDKAVPPGMPYFGVLSATATGLGTAVSACQAQLSPVAFNALTLTCDGRTVRGIS